MAAYQLDARVKFTLRRPLSEDRAELFRAIPGVSVWRARPVIDAPYNAAWIVERMLDTWGMVYVVTPDPFAAVDPEVAIQKHARPELAEGIWSDFMLPFQRAEVVKRVRTGGGHLFAPAGAGKTLMAIVWSLAAPGPVLAVTKANARRQWAGEVARFTTLEPFALLPTAEYRKRDKFRSLAEYLESCARCEQRPFVVVGWEGLRECVDQLDGYGYTSIVFDESHKGKAHKRARWSVTLGDDGAEQFNERRLGNIADLSEQYAKRARRRLTTTATPVADTLADMWGQAVMAEPEAWGRTASKFMVRYCNARPGQFGGLEIQPPGHSNAKELNGRLSFTTSRVPYEVLAAQLPPKRRVVSRISQAEQSKPPAMSREDRAEYKRVMKELGEAAKAGRLDAWAKERLTEQLRLDAADRKQKVVADRIAELATAGKGKILVFHGRKRACEALASAVTGRLRSMQVWMAHGDTSPAAREEIKDAYMSHPGPCVLIGTYHAWGESLNLQDSDAILVPMLPISPYQIDQLEGRGARLGQSRPLLIEYVIAEGTIDERLASILIAKLPAVERITAETSGMLGFERTLKGTDDLEGLLDQFLLDLDKLGDE